jgi:hypothetical protein
MIVSNSLSHSLGQSGMGVQAATPNGALLALAAWHTR